MDNSKQKLKKNLPLLVFAVLLVAISIGQAALPTSWWLEVTKIEVSDGTTEDACVSMDVDRVVNREFAADWLVTIMRENKDGTFSTYRTFPWGWNDYDTDAAFPDDLNICWWTYSKNLGVPYDEHTVFLPEGNYRLRTLWVLDVPGDRRRVPKKSNRFTIRRPAAS